MTTMDDLKHAIMAVLEDATQIEGNGVMHLQGYTSIETDLLKILQAEYNIYFVEPDQPQINLV